MSQQYTTNDVLVLDEIIQHQRVIYYLPVYNRIHYSHFTDVNVSSLTAQMYITIYLYVYYGDLENNPDTFFQSNFKKFIQDNLKLVVERTDEAIYLGGQQKRKMQQTKKLEQANEKILKFKAVKLLALNLEPDVFWTPFQEIESTLSLDLQELVMKQNGIDRIIKFNFMNKILPPQQHPNYSLQKKKIISFDSKIVFGQYDLAQKKLKSQFSSLSRSEQIQCQNQNQKQRQQFQDQLTVDKRKGFYHSHHTIFILKRPAASALSIYLPLFFLSVINKAIYFQDNDFEDRVGSISTMMMALMGLISIVRQQTPKTNKITFIEVLISLEVINGLFCLIESWSEKNLKQQKYVFIWYKSITFIFSLLISITILVSMLILVFKYIFYYSIYNQNARSLPINFNRHQWKNEKCNQLFKNIYPSRGIHVKKYNSNVLLPKIDMRSI